MSASDAGDSEPYEISYTANPDKKYSYCAKDGEARAIFPNEDSYEGNYQGGKRSGEGVYNWTRRGASYEGGYLNGLRHGVGTMNYPDGSVYVGEWLAGLRHGSGTISYKNGDRFTGEWSHNLKHGDGVYVYRSDLTELSGRWHSGVFLKGGWSFYQQKNFVASVEGRKIVEYKN